MLLRLLLCCILSWTAYGKIGVLFGQTFVRCRCKGGFILLIGVFFRQAGWLSTIVLVLFMIGIGQAWARGLVIDCGCFGQQDLTDGGMDYLQTILRDVVLVAMSLWTAYRPYRRFAIYP